MLVPIEIFKQQRQFFANLLGIKKAELVPQILVPQDQSLIEAGYKRPTWLALIFLFFSPNFIHRVIYSSLWPVSPYIPEPLLPWTFILCVSSTLFAF